MLLPPPESFAPLHFHHVIVLLSLTLSLVPTRPRWKCDTLYFLYENELHFLAYWSLSKKNRMNCNPQWWMWRMFVEHCECRCRTSAPPKVFLPSRPGLLSEYIRIAKYEKEKTKKKKIGIDLVIYKMLKSCIDCWLRSAESLAGFGFFFFFFTSSPDKAAVFPVSRRMLRNCSSTRGNTQHSHACLYFVSFAMTWCPVPSQLELDKITQFGLDLG